MEFEFIGSHNDVVNDISFDFYGRRFATCSLDKHIKIWALKEDASADSTAGGAGVSRGVHAIKDAAAAANSNLTNLHSQPTAHWSSFDIPSAHQNAIWRLSWAHPEFGQLLASCSDDHTVGIWEEQEVITRTKKIDEQPIVNNNSNRTKMSTSRTVTSSASLSATVESTSSSKFREIDTSSLSAGGGGGGGGAALSSTVQSQITATSVSAPAHQAAAKVAAAKDSSRWMRKATLSDSKKAVRDVKFAPRHLGLMLACASADGTVRVYEATDVFSLNFWQLQHTVQVERTVNIFSDSTSSVVTSVASSSSGAASISTTSSTPVSVFGGNLDANTSQASAPDVMGESEQGLTCLAWNLCPFEPAKLAVGGYSGRAVIISLEDSKWVEECSLGDLSGGVIHDIAWAPTMGRNYHQIATTSREAGFKVHTLHRTTTGSSGKLEYSKTQSVESTSVIWRVAWNATGTVLATSSEDGTLALWRTNYMGEWRIVQTLPASSKVETASSFYKI